MFILLFLQQFFFRIELIFSLFLSKCLRDCHKLDDYLGEKNKLGLTVCMGTL
jgi:hypothetical protein